MPSLGVLASQGVAYKSTIQFIYNPLGPFLAARLYSYNIFT